MRSLVLPLFIVIFLAGCASGPPRIQPPISADAKIKGASAVRSALLDETNHTMVHLDEAREIVYRQSFGNSVAVGALLGPLGVLANVAATKAVTEGDQAKLKGKIQVSASNAFKTAADETGLQLASAKIEGGVNFSPYLYLVKLSDGNVLLASSLIVEAPTPGAVFPRARYMYQLPLRYTVDELSAATPAMVADIEKQAHAGYVELIRFYQDDKRDAAEKERLVKYKSDFLDPRFDFEVAGRVVAEHPDRVWIRNVFGVAAVLTSNIKIVGPWE